MLIRPYVLLTAALLLLLTGLGHAEVLSESEADSIQAAVAETGGELAALKAFEAHLDLPAGLTQEQAEALIDELWGAYKAGIVTAASEQTEALGELPTILSELYSREEMMGRLRNRQRIDFGQRDLPLGEHVMPFHLIRREIGGVPENGRPLFICTHGGGQSANASGPHAWGVNTQEWHTQSSFAAVLYEPEGLYFVPRMADDRMGRWRHAHHQDQFELAIRHGILFWGVDPNRVYKLGISQGGFASAILGMFMPDLFAGINPMAGGVGLGNPPENLRNLPCFTGVGEQDTMFKRAPNAIATHERLEELHAQDPSGYIHHLDLQPGRGHGIDYRPGAPWIAQHTRNPHPDTVIWTSKVQDGRRRGSVYWLELDGDDLQGTIALTAKIDRANNSVALTAQQLATQNAQGDPTQIGEQDAEATPLAGATVSVLLNDALLDLDRPVTVTCNGEEVFTGSVERDGNTLLETLVRRGDWNYAFPVRIPVVLE